MYDNKQVHNEKILIVVYAHACNFLKTKLLEEMNRCSLLSVFWGLTVHLFVWYQIVVFYKH